MKKVLLSSLLTVFSAPAYAETLYIDLGCREVWIEHVENMTALELWELLEEYKCPETPCADRGRPSRRDRGGNQPEETEEPPADDPDDGSGDGSEDDTDNGGNPCGGNCGVGVGNGGGNGTGNEGNGRGPQR